MEKDSLSVHGFSRLQLWDTADKDGKPLKKPKLAGDSGWQGPNAVVNLGFQDYICAAIGSVAGSKYVTHMLLGTGTQPGVTDTSLEGETRIRKTSTNTLIASQTLQATAEWSSSDNGATCAIKNVGLANTSAGGTILCGNTYAVSTWATNQAVSATYQLRFSQ
ncbi:MAG: hypothetical protein V3V59_02885 [Thermodesulfovibrionales bacterium]